MVRWENPCAYSLIKPSFRTTINEYWTHLFDNPSIHLSCFECVLILVSINQLSLKIVEWRTIIKMLCWSSKIRVYPMNMRGHEVEKNKIENGVVKGKIDDMVLRILRSQNADKLLRRGSRKVRIWQWRLSDPNWVSSCWTNFIDLLGACQWHGGPRGTMTARKFVVERWDRESRIVIPMSGHCSGRGQFGQVEGFWWQQMNGERCDETESSE